MRRHLMELKTGRLGKATGMGISNAAGSYAGVDWRDDYAGGMVSDDEVIGMSSSVYERIATMQDDILFFSMLSYDEKTYQAVLALQIESIKYANLKERIKGMFDLDE